jgi:hypothetical protein
MALMSRITKQFEGGSIKCGNYWEDKKYGPIRVHQVSQTGGEDKTQTANTGFDFGMAATTPKSTETERPAHIQRVFEVTNDDHPESAPRKIIQIQCVSWPDFDVPESADVLLDLIRDVDHAFVDVYGSARNAQREDEPPVLVHCESLMIAGGTKLMTGSAGVGRTGSFIVVDSILDGLRREREHPESARATEKNELDAAPRPINSRHSSGEAVHNPVATLERSVGMPTPILEEPEPEVQPQPPKRMSLSHANMVDHQRQTFLQHRAEGSGSGSAKSTLSMTGSAGNASFTSSERRSMAKSLEALSVPFPFASDSTDSKQWCRERYESNDRVQG